MTMLCDIGGSLRSFFIQLTAALGFDLLFALSIAIEVFFILLFLIKTAFSYELRLRRGLDRANNWLFKNKKIDQGNIKEFNDIIKKGPRRLSYFWQQFILYREHEPSYYMSADNLIEKPLKTSSFASNIKNLNIVTTIWTAVTLLLGVAYQTSISGSTLRTEELIGALIIPILVLFLGLITTMIMKSRKTSNLDEIYHIYHIYARFVDNACVDLPPYIDYDLLFSPKEIEHGNPQLREYWEARARKAKEEFEKAKQTDVEYVEYDFNEAGVDGSLVLERAMKESETYMNKKSSTLAKIAHVEAQQEALKRNYENVQKDLQRKIQASKENIQKLIQQQEATTNRMEVGFLRKQQEQEISKQESLQNEYDQEETRYAVSNEELNQEIAKLNDELDKAKDATQKAMVAEYQTFYEKVMKGAYEDAEKRVEKEKTALKTERDAADRELTIVQTQIKRLIDENETLRARLGEDVSNKKEEQQKGEYDEHGNYVYADGSYHDPNGLFHDVDGKVYDMNGTLILEPETETPNVQPQVQEVEQTVEETTIEEEPVEKQEEQKAKKEKKAKGKVEDVTAEELGLAPVVAPEILPVVVEETADQVQKPEQEQTEQVVEKEESAEPKEQEKEEPVKRGRGRPRKPVVEQEPKTPRKRGRPRKDESAPTTKRAIVSEKDGLPKTAPTKEKTTKSVTKTKTAAKTKQAAEKAEQKPETKPTATRGRGRPRTVKAETSEPKTTATPKKAKKSSTKSKSVAKTEMSKKPAKKLPTKSNAKSTKAKKDDLDLVSLAKINKLITEEEARLSRMKALVNSEISDALNSNEEREITEQRDELIKSVEELRARAEKARAEGKNEEELSSINGRLEALIKEISDMNGKN